MAPLRKSYPSDVSDEEWTFVAPYLAQAGMAPWTADLWCNVLSLFRRTNAEALTGVRAHWRAWLRARRCRRSHSMTRP